MEQSLAGVRVVEIASWVAAPTAAAVLADLGAEVIKVEPPTGDPSRGVVLSDSGAPSPITLVCNAGKRSVTLDLTDPADQQAVIALIGTADVVVENFHAGTAKFGLDLDELLAANPGLIWASVRGFGPHGSWRDRPAVDPVAQAESGLMNLTGAPDGEPYRTGAPVIDFTTGYVVAGRIMAALLDRHRTGHGVHFVQSLFDVAFSMQAATMTDYLHSGKEPERIGNASPNSHPVGVFDSADGSVLIAVTSERQWSKFATGIGRPDLVEDERFGTGRDRVRHRDALTAEIESTTRQLTSDRLLEVLNDAGCMAGRVRTGQDVLDLDEVSANGLLRHVRDARGVEHVAARLPFTAGTQAAQVPIVTDIGADNDAVLNTLALGRDQLSPAVQG